MGTFTGEVTSVVNSGTVEDPTVTLALKTSEGEKNIVVRDNQFFVRTPIDKLIGRTVTVERNDAQGIGSKDKYRVRE